MGDPTICKCTDTKLQGFQEMMIFIKTSNEYLVFFIFVIIISRW